MRGAGAWWARRWGLAAVIVAAISCSGDTSTRGKDPVASARYSPSLRIDLTVHTKSASGLYWHDLIVGTGEAADTGQTVAVRYKGWLRDGTRFIALDDPPYEFVLGTGGVIAAWDEGVRGMKVGGVRQLIVPPALAFGANANGPVPPNAVVIYKMELVEIK